MVREYKTEKGLVRIHVESEPVSPRVWDNVVTLHTRQGCPYFDNESPYETYDELITHYGVTQSGYDRPAMYRDIENLINAAKEKGDIVKPLSIYSHSGDYLYIGTPKDHFDGRWDCSLVGFGIIDSETIKREWDGDIEVAEKYFKGEIETLSHYIAGEVYWYELLDAETGEVIDSCGGFYGSDVSQNGIEDYVGKEVA